MNALRRLRLFFACGLACLATTALRGVEPDGEAIVDRFLATQKADSEMAFIKMRVERDDGAIEERRFLAVYRREADGSAGYLVRLVRPREIQGVTLLSKQAADGTVQPYLYLPTIGKTRALTGDARSTPFLGSDFSIEDLVREVPGTQSYERLDDTIEQGAPCYRVRATPIDPESSSYGYRDLYIDQELANLRRVNYHDKSGRLVKVFTAHDYQSPEIYGATTRPRRAIMVDPSAGNRTIFTVLVGRIDEPIDPRIFDPKFIESWDEEAVNEFMYPLVFEVFGTP